MTRHKSTHIKRRSLLRFLYFIFFGPLVLPMQTAIQTNKELLDRSVKQHIRLRVQHLLVADLPHPLVVAAHPPVEALGYAAVAYVVPLHQLGPLVRNHLQLTRSARAYSEELVLGVLGGVEEIVVAQVQLLLERHGLLDLHGPLQLPAVDEAHQLDHQTRRRLLDAVRPLLALHLTASSRAHVVGAAQEQRQRVAHRLDLRSHSRRAPTELEAMGSESVRKDCCSTSCRFE